MQDSEGSRESQHNWESSLTLKLFGSSSLEPFFEYTLNKPKGALEKSQKATARKGLI